MRGEQAAAEGVDRQSPRRARWPARPAAARRRAPRRRPRASARAPGDQLAPDPGAHLGGGALGEGEGEDPVDLDAVVGDRGAVAVDEHRRLAACRRRPRGRRRARGRRSRRAARRSARSRARRGRRDAARRLRLGRRRLERRPRLSCPSIALILRCRSRRRPIARSSRQIAWKVQYFGHLPPIGWRRDLARAHLAGGRRARAPRPRRARSSKSSCSQPVGADDPESLQGSSSSRATSPRGLRRSPTAPSGW